MRIMISAVLATILFASLVCAESEPALHTDKNACMEGPIAEFGRYVGDWKITDEAFAQDGSGWGPGNGKRWIFECVGPGLAVQDYWLPKTGNFGTNLRTYNPDTQSWEIIWAATALNGLTHISAKQNAAGEIIMDVLKPVYDQPRRIIFYPPDDTGWNWLHQWSFDDGETWTDVYRMKATPWEE